MKLSKNDEAILNSYKPIIQGLGAYLGEGYEIALHNLGNPSHSIIAIYNGQLSSRKLGDPLSSLTLNVLDKIQKDKLPNDCLAYFNRNVKGEPIKAMATAIRGANNKIIGLLCINFYLNTPFTRIMGGFIPQHNSLQKAPVLENFVSSTDEIISSAVIKAKEAVDSDPSISAKDRNKEIIQHLKEDGIFGIKKAIPVVANQLNISKNTIYLHLRNS